MSRSTSLSKSSVIGCRRRARLPCGAWGRRAAVETSPCALGRFGQRVDFAAGRDRELEVVELLDARGQHARARIDLQPDIHAHSPLLPQRIDAAGVELPDDPRRGPAFSSSVSGSMTAL